MKRNNSISRYKISSHTQGSNHSFITFWECQQVSATQATPNKDRVVVSMNPQGYWRSITDNPESHALTRAMEIEAVLSHQFPSFIKTMTRSNVAGSSWLGLPRSFCEMNLPVADDRIVLEDENGEEYGTKYVAFMSGLRGGWRRFSLDHRLDIGDVLVFHLIQPLKFKVYIVKLQEPNSEVDVALNLLRLLDGPVNQPGRYVPPANDPNGNGMFCLRCGRRM